MSRRYREHSYYEVERARASVRHAGSRDRSANSSVRAHAPPARILRSSTCPARSTTA